MEKGSDSFETQQDNSQYSKDRKSLKSIILSSSSDTNNEEMSLTFMRLSRLSSGVIDIDSPGIPQDAPEKRIYLTMESQLYGKGPDTLETQ